MRKFLKTIGLFMLFVWTLAFASACTNMPVQSSLQVKQSKQNKKELFGSTKPAEILVGKVSWYGTPFHGRRTANGEIYNMYEMTAAHKTLPFGTRLFIVNPVNQRSLVVRINDRGPYVEGRIVDLSYAAAKELGMAGTGVAKLWMAIYLPEANPHKVAMVRANVSSLRE